MVWCWSFPPRGSWLRRTSPDSAYCKGLEEHGRGIRGVFAKDESNFQKLLRQGVQSDAVLSHVRLQPAKTIPALFPGPQGHLRVMKSSQLPLRGAGGATPTNLRARWLAAHPPQAGNVHSLQVRRPGDTRQFQPQTAWYWPGGPGWGKGTDSHPVQDGRWLGTSIVLLGLLGGTPRFKSFHTWKESQGWPPTCCLGVKHSSTQTPSPTLSSPPPPHPPPRPGQDWRMRGTGLGPHKPGLGRAVIIWGGSLASCSVPASGKSYVSAKSQESESQPRALQSVLWAIAPSTPGTTWVSASLRQQLWTRAPGPLCPGSTQASGASRWQHRKFREGWGLVVVLSPV